MNNIYKLFLPFAMLIATCLNAGAQTDDAISALHVENLHDVICNHSPIILAMLVSILAMLSFAVFILLSKRRAHQTASILKLLPVRIIVADKNGEICYFGQGSLSDFEFKAPLKNLSNFYNQKVAGTIRENIVEVIKTGESKTVHFEINGQKRTANVIKIPYSIFHKNVAGWISQDTESLQTAVAVSKFQARKFSQILQSIGDGVIVTDKLGAITLMNPVAEEMTGYFDKEAIGKNISDVFKIVERDTERSLPSPLNESIKSGKIVNLSDKVDLIKKDGSRLHISDSSSPIIDEGNVVGAVLVFRDITVEDKRNDELHDANSILNVFIDNVPSYIVAKDIDNDLRYAVCNKAFSDMVGLPRNEIIGHQDKEFFHVQDELDSFLKYDLECVKFDKIINHIIPFTGVSGVTRIGNFHWVPIKLSGGKHWLYVIVDDITELYKSKIESENLAERLKLTLNSIGDGVIVTDIVGNIAMLNPVAQHMMGCTQEEALGKPHTEYFHIVNSVDNWKTPSPLTRSLRTGEIVELANHTDLLSKDGRRLNIADSSAPIRNNEGKIVGGILVFRDVSEEYVQRRKLMNLTILLTSIMDNLPAEMFLKDADDFKYLMANPAIERLMRVPKEEIIGKTDFDLLPEDVAARVRESDIDALNTDDLHETTLAHKIPDGLDHYSRFYRKKIKTSDGKTQILSIVIDITEQEKQRIALESQKKISDKYNRDLQEYVLQNDLQKRCITGMLSVDDFSNSFDRIADMVGNYLHASCVTIERYVACDAPYLSSLKIWNSNGSKPAFNLAKIMESDFPQVFAHLKNGGVIRLKKSEHKAGDLSGWRSEVLDYLEKAKVEELICVPIIRENKFWGYLGSEIYSPNLSDFYFGDVGERMIITTANLIEILLAREDMRNVQQRSDEEKFMILNMLPMPVMMLGSNYEILHANREAEIMLGSDLKNALRHSCKEFLCRRDVLDETCCPVFATLKTGKSQSYEKTIKDRTYMINTMPIFHDGRIEKVIKVYIDLTDINHHKKLLQDAVKKAEDAARGKSQFLATMSHEIRTPLNAVVGFSELLQNANVSEGERQEYLKSINLAGNALLELINDILDLSKIDADKMTINEELLDIGKVVNEMLSIFKHKLEEKNLSLKLNLAADMPNIFIDARKFRQVLLNLIGNALKFTNTGEIELSVDFIPTASDGDFGTLEVRVKDTGIGITEENREKIFDPFVQDENPLQNKYQGGTGLGLPIAKRLIEAMGGKLMLETKLGYGSTFIVNIPNLSVSRDAVKMPMQQVRNGGDKSAKVLIVDDVQMNLKVLGAMLKNAGYSYKTSSSGKTALEMLKTEQFSHVLTDLWMPEMDGVQLAERIKKLPNCRNVKVVVVTADAINNNSEKTKVFDGILLKPISMDSLGVVLS